MTLKYIEKAIEDAQTGADAKYHEITTINADYINNSVAVTLASYVSAKAKASGKQALSYNTATLTPAPSRDTVLHDWALNTLIQPQPEDYTVPEYGSNPYAFAGGKIKEIAE